MRCEHDSISYPASGFFWNGPWFNQQNLTRDHFFLLYGTRTGILSAEVFFQLGKWIIDHNKSWMECWVTRMRAFPQDINQLTMQTFNLNLIIGKFKDICHFGRIPDCLLRIIGTSGTREKPKGQVEKFLFRHFLGDYSPVGITFWYWLKSGVSLHQRGNHSRFAGRRCGNSTRAVERSKKCWGSRDGKHSQGRNTTFWLAKANLILLMIWKRFWCKASGSI